MTTGKKARGWLEAVVDVDNTSRHSRLALIECGRGALATLGVTARLFHSPDGAKDSLFATLPAGNGETQGGIVLSGHTDVVPVDGQQWSTNPFMLAEKDGRPYGRGSCDMKGVIAAALGPVPGILAPSRAQHAHLQRTWACVGRGGGVGARRLRN